MTRRLLEYAGYHGCPSRCAVLERRVGRATWIVFSELPDNPGTSVTNFIEHLATLYRASLPPAEAGALRFFEHYPRRGSRGQFAETFDEVMFARDEGGVFASPLWRRVTDPRRRAALEALVREG